MSKVIKTHPLQYVNGTIPIGLIVDLGPVVQNYLLLS